MVELLDLLKLTPSGGNQQAWNIQIKSQPPFHTLEVSIKEMSYFEYTDAFSFGRLISLGMLQYSVDYLAEEVGFKVISSKISKTSPSTLPKVIIELQELITERTSYSHKIQTFKNRFTNRSLYLNKKIDDDILKNILRVKSKTFILSTEEKLLAIELQKKLSLIRFQNKFLFKEMLSEISIHDSETGIPLKNLGLNKLMQMTIKFSKLFPVSLPFDFFYNYPIAQSIVAPMQHSSEICVLTEESENIEAWITLGYRFMQTWLDLTAVNVHLQPIGNTLILSNYFHNSSLFAFSDKHQRRLHDLEYFKASHHLLDLKKPNIFFRIGYSDIPFLKTPRKKVETNSLFFSNVLGLN